MNDINTTPTIAIKRMRYLSMSSANTTTSAVSKSGDYYIEIKHEVEEEGLTETGAQSHEECELHISFTSVSVGVFSFKVEGGIHRRRLFESRNTILAGQFDGSVKAVVAGRNYETEREYYKSDLSPLEAYIAVMNFANKWLKK